MRGINKLTLNTSTMMEIVQYWLDTRVFVGDLHSPYVVGLTTGTQETWAFVVELSDIQPATS